MFMKSMICVLFRAILIYFRAHCVHTSSCECERFIQCELAHINEM